MANWVVFNNTIVPAATVAINLDMVKSIMAGVPPNTVSLDGILVEGDFETVVMMTSHQIAPGVVGSPVTTS